MPTYAGLRYVDLYPGIDLQYAGHEDRLKSTYLVELGADPGQIRWRYVGAKSVVINETTGNLVITVETDAETRTLYEEAPVAWQEVGAQRQAVAVCYVLTPKGTVELEVGEYNPALPLIIDPVTLAYSTYLGEISQDWANGIAVDSSGNAYVTGSTLSSNFPTQNPYDPSQAGYSIDAFITKFAATGSTLVYSTYLGGSGLEDSYGIAVDNNGCAYVIGETQSSDFPLKSAYDSDLGGGADAFATKLTADGNALAYSTYLGGSNSDDGRGIAVDSNGNAYVTGNTESADFPTQNAYDASLDGDHDAFVTKFSAVGNTLTYSTYLGGWADEYGYGIAVDNSGNAYTIGTTNSSDFPTQNAYDVTLGSQDAFVTKFSTAGNTLVYSTFLGGWSGENGYGIAVDSSGCAYVTGETISSDFPTQNAYDSVLDGREAFVTKLTAAGTALVYSTYLGGSSAYDYGYGIAVDSSGCAYVTGETWSLDFPTQNAYDTSRGGSWDAFVTKFSAAGNALVYSTYLGGSDWERSNSIAVDSSGNAYVTGHTESSDFPTQNAYDSSYERNTDVFVTKFGPASQVSHGYLLWTK